MISVRLKLVFLLAWLCLAVPVGAFPLRVLVEGPKPAMVISVSEPARYQGADGRTVDLQPGQFFNVTAERLGTLKVSNRGLILVGDRWYPETVYFTWYRGGVAAINYVDSETYLRGVVPREMPENYHPEALKAQAIAARTYALTSFKRRKHGKDFDLVDTVIDQVYGGFARFDARTGRSRWLVDPRTDRAVAETKGIVLNFERVHGEYRDKGIAGWMKYGQYMLPIRKGALLSQTVSHKMALAGWNYQQILYYWYQSALYQLPQNM
jgi:stage II sporulation protein D